MRIFILCSLCFILLFSPSCNKESESTIAKSQTWVVYDKIYNQELVQRNIYKNYYDKDSLLGVLFTSHDSDTNRLLLYFTEPPIGGRSYKIVYNPKTKDEVSVSHFSYNHRGAVAKMM